jgi:hypothetical protein
MEGDVVLGAVAASRSVLLPLTQGQWRAEPLTRFFSWPNLLTNDTRSLGQGRSLRLR